MKRLILLFILVMQAAFSFGQLQTIRSISIYPENPKDSDSIEVNLFYSTSYSTDTFGFETGSLNDSIWIKQCVAGGPQPSVREYHDTLKLGVLTAGDYQLNFTIYASASWDSCTYLNPVDSIITFKVTQNTGMEGEFQKDFKLYPNPANDFVQTSLQKSLSVDVYDFRGQLKMSAANFDSQHPIDIRNLSNGVYFLYFPKSRQAKLIVIQGH